VQERRRSSRPQARNLLIGISFLQSFFLWAYCIKEKSVYQMRITILDSRLFF